MVDDLMGEPAMQLLSSHISCTSNRLYPTMASLIHLSSAFVNSVFPQHRQMYLSLRDRLGIKPGKDSHVYESSPFLGTSINLGPMSESRTHRDPQNLAGGICAIGAFGRFDHRVSGHLILVEPKLIIEMKHGDVVVIPSAAVTHCNSPLHEGDDRVSVVQYTAAGCFRYNYQGDRTQGEMHRSEVAAINAQGDDRFMESWNLFSSLSDFETARMTGTAVCRDVSKEVDAGQSLLIRARSNTTLWSDRQA